MRRKLFACLFFALFFSASFCFGQGSVESLTMGRLGSEKTTSVHLLDDSTLLVQTRFLTQEKWKNVFNFNRILGQWLQSGFIVDSVIHAQSIDYVTRLHKKRHCTGLLEFDRDSKYVLSWGDAYLTQEFRFNLMKEGRNFPDAVYGFNCALGSHDSLKQIGWTLPNPSKSLLDPLGDSIVQEFVFDTTILRLVVHNEDDTRLLLKVVGNNDVVSLVIDVSPDADAMRYLAKCAQLTMGEKSVFVLASVRPYAGISWDGLGDAMLLYKLEVKY